MCIHLANMDQALTIIDTTPSGHDRTSIDHLTTLLTDLINNPERATELEDIRNLKIVGLWIFDNIRKDSFTGPKPVTVTQPDGSEVDAITAHVKEMSVGEQNRLAHSKFLDEYSKAKDLIGNFVSKAKNIQSFW